MSTCVLVTNPNFLIKMFWAATTVGSLLLALAASLLLHLGKDASGVLPVSRLPQWHRHRRGGGGSCCEATSEEVFRMKDVGSPGWPPQPWNLVTLHAHVNKLDFWLP
jgi:hypothetical protein